MKKLTYILSICSVLVSCGTVKEVVPVEKEIVKEQIADRNGFREVKSCLVTFYYSNSSKYSFTISTNPTKNRNSMDLAFQKAEEIVKKDSTVINYTVKPIIKQNTNEDYSL